MPAAGAGRSGSWPRTDACAHGLQRAAAATRAQLDLCRAGSAHAIPASTNPRPAAIAGDVPAASRPTATEKTDRCPGPAPVRRTARSPHQRRRRPHRQRVAPRQSRRFAHTPLCPRTPTKAQLLSQHGGSAHLKPPGTGEALTPWTWTCGSENTVIVARPPNGTSGATTSLPSWAETVASTVALRPNSVAVPRRVSRPSAGGDRGDRLEDRRRRPQVGLGRRRRCR